MPAHNPFRLFELTLRVLLARSPVSTARRGNSNPLCMRRAWPSDRLALLCLISAAPVIRRKGVKHTRVAAARERAREGAGGAGANSWDRVERRSN
jgi:hypothetical protein